VTTTWDEKARQRVEAKFMRWRRLVEAMPARQAEALLPNAISLLSGVPSSSPSLKALHGLGLVDAVRRSRGCYYWRSRTLVEVFDELRKLQAEAEAKIMRKVRR